MLKRLHLQNFTVFADADFEFSPGLNVLVGANGTGKSHVLKLGYAVVDAAHRASLERGLFSHLDYFLGNRLQDVFQSGSLGNLVRRDSQAGAAVNGWLVNGSEAQVQFQLNANHSNQETANAAISETGLPLKFPVFIPAKEILSLMPDIVGLARNYPDLFDDTYSALAAQLTIRVPINIPAVARGIMERWATIMQGVIDVKDGRFYFQSKDGNKIGIDLAAEGFRKLGTLSHLLANNTLTSETVLFWDEPESNLNPLLLRELAIALAELARQGFQIILATHSMSLLKEFHILSRQKDAKPLPIRYFGLNAEPGQPTTVIAKDDFEYLPDVVALQVELEQADALEEVFIQDDQKANADRR